MLDKLGLLYVISKISRENISNIKKVLSESYKDKPEDNSCCARSCYTCRNTVLVDKTSMGNSMQRLRIRIDSTQRNKYRLR